ncbi:response regulator transcription factor [Tengunoibacter tsumagoiensis]|uniref:HTH luxR-type domain-containing protein n=1 Tax=Tengunoibacter tsumagoiensis TaxID=2014871 RepID=A0A402A760_9CHLR|nr:LuxR C-terminal-related transcriptional regulator [Tengunoibacter tsumagoiensis]GCE14866.1 hypothetical protein KTT_47250 [Tengunoibacter tsumagoiensis]
MSSTQQLRPQHTQVAVAASQYHTKPTSSAYEAGHIDSIQYVLRLLWASQTIVGQTTKVAEQLCREVTNITQGKAQLTLRDREGNQLTASPTGRTLFSFSVQFGEVVYGTLCIAPDPEQLTLPSIPFTIAQLLAQICGWLLHAFEQSIFLQGQCQHLSTPLFVSLTKREREVLTLMCLGHSQQSIARKLSISPTTVGKHRQHIYEQLGVHSEHDALLAAYRFGLFSILDLPQA